MENNKLKREDAGDYYQKLKLPENQYEVFAKLTSLNSPQALLSSTYSRLVGFPIFLQEFSKALGTNEGIYFDLSELSGTIRKISDFQPLTEEDRTKLQTLPPVFIELAEDENNKILALIESNKRSRDLR